MISTDLNKLKDEALSFLLAENQPCLSKIIARHLFGESRHEEPVAQLLVRAILEQDSRFIKTHDNLWSASDISTLNLPINDARFVVVDLEATGSLIGVDRIIEVGIAVVENGQIIKQFSSLVQSDRKISHRVRKLTGISHDDLVDARSLAETMLIVKEMLSSADVFVAHDVRFDMHFLRWEMKRQGLELPSIPGICTVHLSQQLWPDLDGWRLVDLSNGFGLSHNHPHRAGEDAIATAGVLAYALDDAIEIGAKTVLDLLRLPELISKNNDKNKSSDIA
jgi:DNA polymerase III epsilon subunit family exonuclease